MQQAAGKVLGLDEKLYRKSSSRIYHTMRCLLERLALLMRLRLGQGWELAKGQDGQPEFTKCDVDIMAVIAAESCVNHGNDVCYKMVAHLHKFVKEPGARPSGQDGQVV